MVRAVTERVRAFVAASRIAMKRTTAWSSRAARIATPSRCAHSPAALRFAPGCGAVARRRFATSGKTYATTLRIT